MVAFIYIIIQNSGYVKTYREEPFSNRLRVIGTVTYLYFTLRAAVSYRSKTKNAFEVLYNVSL